MKKQIVVLLVICFCSAKITGQVKEFKFGKIEPSEFVNNIYPIDSNAGAYIVAAYGHTYFNFVQSKSDFEIIYNCKLRIKILKSTEFDKANYKFSIYSFDGSFEQYSIKAVTMNLENGKVVKSKFSNDAKFEELIDKNQKDIKITMPNVREGSVIDIDYSITSDYMIRDWSFQEDIPVLYSKYVVEVPEYYSFKKFLNGFESIDTKEDVVSSKINITQSERSDGLVTTTKLSNYSIDYRTFVSEMTGKNLPAFKAEPYLTSEKNYISSIEFELESIQFPSSPIKYYTKNWESINNELLNYENFGGELKGNGFIEDTVAKLTSGITNDIDKAAAIYYYLSQHMKWNGFKRMTTSKSLKKAYQEKSGNSADINLLLTVMLNKAGLKADPVIISTRDNGIVLMAYPVLSKFNYVIASVNIAGKTILMDATSPSCPFGVLPKRCLNAEGRIIREINSANVSLKPTANYSYTNFSQIKLNANGDLTGSMQVINKGYSAIDIRNDIKEAKSLDDYVKKMQDKMPGLTIGKHMITPLDTINKPLSTILDSVVISGKVENNGNIVTLNPMLYEQINNNPFKLEDRKYPVDYGYPIENTYVLQLEIPEGFVIDELPKSSILALSENAAKFTYNITQSGNKIQLIRKFSISKILYMDNDYKDLKEFYNQVVAKESQLLVLKKAQVSGQVNH